MSLPVILVRRTGRGNVVGDLHAFGMWPGQRSGESDAGAGDLFTSRMRMSEWRGYIDCGGAETSHGGDNRCVSIRAAADGDGLTIVKTHRVSDRDHSGAHAGGGAHCGGACRAHRRDDGGLAVRSGTDHDLLASVKTFHAGNLNVR